ncbi:MAG: response regulator [Bryobacterales bacterium]|nr:response regulator [Bryobacterales bacterium]
MPASSRVVLVVEDSPADQEILRRAFRAVDIGCDLHMVLDGEAALCYLQQIAPYRPATAPQPDFILLDLNLPNLTGREVLERIRANPRIRHIPVIILTTTQAPNEILECYRLGANCFITKPPSFHDFVDLIRATSTYWFQFANLPPHSPPGPAPLQDRPLP